MTISLQNLELTGSKILATDLEHGLTKTAGGILIKDDVGTNEGIRPRWAKIAKIGPDITEVSEGEWVLIEHGRWSYGFDVLDDSGETVKVWHIDSKAMLVASTADPRRQNFDFGK